MKKAHSVTAVTGVCRIESADTARVIGPRSGLGLRLNPVHFYRDRTIDKARLWLDNRSFSSLQWKASL
jgi:hypothetical protein